MKLMLHDMAECGMAASPNVESADASLVSEYNVGGLVSSSAAVFCVPASVLAVKAAVCGIVPSTQFFRHLIANALFIADAEAAADVKAASDAQAALDDAKAASGAAADAKTSEDGSLSDVGLATMRWARTMWRRVR
jgi:hypothetical protein